MKNHFINAFCESCVFATRETNNPACADSVLQLAETCYTKAAPFIKGTWVDRCAHAIALQIIGTGCCIDDNLPAWYYLDAQNYDALRKAFENVSAECYSLEDEEGGEMIETYSTKGL